MFVWRQKPQAVSSEAYVQLDLFNGTSALIRSCISSAYRTPDRRKFMSQFKHIQTFSPCQLAHTMRLWRFFILAPSSAASDLGHSSVSTFRNHALIGRVPSTKRSTRFSSCASLTNCSTLLARLGSCATNAGSSPLHATDGSTPARTAARTMRITCLCDNLGMAGSRLPEVERVRNVTNVHIFPSFEPACPN